MKIKLDRYDIMTALQFHSRYVKTQLRWHFPCFALFYPRNKIAAVSTETDYAFENVSESKGETGEASGRAGEWNLHIHRILTEQPFRRMYRGRTSSPWNIDKTGSRHSGAYALTAHIIVWITCDAQKSHNERHFFPIDKIRSTWTRLTVVECIKNAKNFFSKLRVPALSLSLLVCLIPIWSNRRHR